MQKRDNDYFSTTGCLVNRESNRYVRVMWLDIYPDWDRVSSEQAFIRSIYVEDTQATGLILEIAIFSNS